jgi:hypothetical protein
MKVSVIMANDFPECVFRDDGLARRYCEKLMEAPENQIGGLRGAHRIHYRIYTFELKETL